MTWLREGGLSAGSQQPGERFLRFVWFHVHLFNSTQSAGDLEKKQDCALFMKVIVTSGQKYMIHAVPEAREYSQDIARASNKDSNKWV